jgi:hypothetical protein
VERALSRETNRLAYGRGDPCLGLGYEGGLTSKVVLTGTATRTLARHDGTTLEDLTTPDAPGLLALKSTRQALNPKRAVAAKRLRQLKLGRCV